MTGPINMAEPINMTGPINMTEPINMTVFNIRTSMLMHYQKQTNKVTSSTNDHSYTGSNSCVNHHMARKISHYNSLKMNIISECVPECLFIFNT